MLRVIELSVPSDKAEELRSLLEDQELVCNWQQQGLGDCLCVQLVVRTPQAEPLLDLLQQRFARVEDFRALVIRVHATVPELEEPEPDPADPDVTAEAAAEDSEPPPQRVARAEIRNELENGVDMGPVYLATVILSSVIASIGLIKGNTAVIIGAMVVAPLLTPNMALAFAATIGDLTLLARAARTSAVGAMTAFAFALLVGWLADTPQNAEILSRTAPGWEDLALALASGSAGALAFTSGVSASLVGVMVAVALLPPLIVAGLMLTAGEPRLAGGALTLLAINAIGVVLAAIGTFAWRGVTPATWWEKDKARRYTRRATAIGIVLAAALLALVFFVLR